MTTTNAWLDAQSSSRLAMTLIFDGVDLAYTTADSPSSIATALAPTGQWTNVKAGLMVKGGVAQELEAFDPDLNVSTMTFRLMDADGSLARQVLASPATDAVTYLREDLDPSDGTATAVNTTAFDASGDVYIGHECAAYSAKAGAPDPTFTLSDRGKFSLFGPEGGGGFARRHTGSLRRSELPGLGVTPEIRSAPNVDTWPNRMVALVLHHEETTPTGAAWSEVTLPLADSDSRVLWVGRVKRWQDNADGTISFECESAEALLKAHLFSRQFRGSLAAGGYFVGDSSPVAVSYYDGDLPATEYNLDGELFGGFTSGAYTVNDIIAGIQAQLDEWTTGSDFPRTGGAPYHSWSIELKSGLDHGPRVVIEVKAAVSSFQTSGPVLGLSPKIWDLLGFGPGKNSTSGSYATWEHRIPRAPGDYEYFVLKAPNPPRLYRNPASLTPGELVLVEGEDGEWVEQPTVPAEIAAASGASVVATGFLKIGDSLFGVAKSAQLVGSSGASVFQLCFAVNQDEQTTLDSTKFLELGDAAPQCRQVWCERAPAGQLLLQGLLSTGEAGYNSTDYDVYSAGFGLGVPYELLDVASFESLDVDYELMLDKPVPMQDLLKQILAVYNRHLIQDNGRLSLTRPGFDTSLADAVSLGEDTKCREDDRAAPVYNPDGVINHIVLYYTTLRTARQRNWSTVERSEHYVSVEDLVSVSRAGGRRSLEIKARGVLDPDAWRDYIAEPILRYFTRPHCIITRSISLRAQSLLPGDAVSLTDDSIVDPTTGQRGVSGLATWVKAIRFDYESGEGEVDLYFLPGHPARYARLAPSALITGYDAGTKTLTCAAHAYSRSTDDVDVAAFSVGDLVQGVELSPDPVSSPDVVQDEIASINPGANTITLVNGVALAGGLTYVLEPREVASASIPTATQRNNLAFIGDEEDHLIAGAYAAKTWAGPTKSLDQHLVTGITYDQRFIRPADRDSEADQPLSARKLVNLFNNCNNLLGYTTRNSVSFVFTQDATSTAYRLVPGGFWLPLTGVNPNAVFSRGLVGKILLTRLSGTTWAKVVSSTALARGTSSSDYTYGAQTFETEVSSATRAWKDFTLTPALTKLNGQLGTFIHVEVKNTAGSGQGGVASLSLVEAVISV